MPQSIEEVLLGNLGVQGGVGNRAISAALAKGFTKEQIQAAAQSSAIQAKDKGGLSTAVGNIGGGATSSFSQADPTAVLSGTKRDETTGQVVNVDGSQLTAEQHQEFRDHQAAHTGGADTASMKIGGMTDTQIRDHMLDTGTVNWQALGSGNESYNEMWQGVQTGATNEAINTAVTPWSNKVTQQQGQISTLEGNYSTLQGHYDTLKGKYDDMGKQYTNLQADVAQAAKDAMKIKYTGSTAVQNPSAMGIQAAQGTPFKGSGLAGTAALARPNKGLKIKTLNV